MRVLITGGAGFLGQRLARSILASGVLAGRDGAPAPVSRLLLLDTVAPSQLPAGAEAMVGDITEPASLRRALGDGIDSVFHLAAVVSAAAEADFDFGMRVNLDGTRAVLDACRALDRPPRLVFASSVAVFGGDLPKRLDDATAPAPQTSYGTQKAIGELLVADYSRKGFIDGRSLRRVAGAAPVARISWQPDPLIQRIVAGWPGRFDAKRARRLGFEADTDIDEIIRAFIDEELGGKPAAK